MLAIFGFLDLVIFFQTRLPFCGGLYTVARQGIVNESIIVNRNLPIASRIVWFRCVHMLFLLFGFIVPVVFKLFHLNIFDCQRRACNIEDRRCFSLSLHVC